MAAELDALVKHLEALVAEYRATLGLVRTLDDNFRCEGCDGCRRCRFCTGCTRCDECTYCEGCEECVRCNRCKGSVRCRESSQLELCDGCDRSQHLVLCLACVDSSHCFACVGLAGEEFCVLNQRLPRKEYFRVVAALRAQLDGSPLARDPLAAPAGATSPRFSIDTLQRIKAKVRAATPELTELAALLTAPANDDDIAWQSDALARVHRAPDGDHPSPPHYALITWSSADAPHELARAPLPPGEPDPSA